MNYTEQIRSYARQLKLSNLANRPFDFLAEPVPNEVFLVECLKEEINYREEKAKQRRITQAVTVKQNSLLFGKQFSLLFLQ